MHKESIDDELLQTSPWLMKQRQEGDGMQMPEGYFDGLESRLMERIASEGHKRNLPMTVVKKPARRISRMQWTMAIAATLALVLTAVWFFKPGPEPVAPATASVDLTDEEIEAYMLENVQDFDSEELAMIAPEEITHESTPETLKNSKVKTKESHEEITPEDIDHILNDMTEEELEEIL